MATNNLTNTENILIKVDQNNLIHIDPNSVVDNDGNVQPRNVQQENLVMYVNLEADLVPRTTLINNDNKNTMTFVAGGALNFMKNQNGQDFDSTWTETYTPYSTNKFEAINIATQASTGINPHLEQNWYDTSAQSFGINSIDISINSAAIPRVNMTFIDVRGKTLFESPEKSPYKAFFHVPWPIFYLTVKGYYGKAIRYRLHLVKFSSKFNESNGNFEISTTFVGSTYAYLSDIPLKGIVNAPYMYSSESTVKPVYNPSTKTYDKKVSKSARGYSILKSVYAEYKQKGYLPEDFPVKTLREIAVVSQTLDKLLEGEILSEVVNVDIFKVLKEMGDSISSYDNDVKTWARTTLSTSATTINNTSYYYLLGNASEKTSGIKITGTTNTNTLESIIKKYNKQIQDSQTLANKLKINGKSKIDLTKVNVKLIGDVSNYYTTKGTNFVVAIDLLYNQIQEIQRTFEEQRVKFENIIEEKMNEIIKDPKKGIGFSPTIKNIFAVLLANAEVFIRLLKETHSSAFNVSEKRKNVIKNFSTESVGENIYPWPEIKKQVNNDQKVPVYPGNPDMITKLGSDDRTLWPEVDFIENYHGISIQKYDPLGEKEGGVNQINYVFESNSNEYNSSKIGALSNLTKYIPYSEQIPTSLLYEIYERAYNFTFFDSFNSDTLTELAKIEFNNISKSINENDDLTVLLHDKITNRNELITNLESYSPYQRYPYYQDSLPTTDYLSKVIETPFKIEQYTQFSGISKDYQYTKLNDNLLNYILEDDRKYIYPFSSDLYLSYQNKTKDSFKSNVVKIDGNLKVDTLNGFICSPNSPKSWVKNDYTQNIFDQKLLIDNSSVNILNTPYFHKQLYSDFNNGLSYGKYVGSAYLLLNSLPFNDLEDEINFNNSGSSINMATLFKEIGATHMIPYHLIVKWGSIYHRYKKYILEGVDILDGFLTTGNTTTTVDGNLFFNNYQTGTTFTTYSINGTNVEYSGSTPDIGIHPYYDAIYSQIVNGYAHYNTLSGNTSYSGNVSNGTIYERQRTNNGTRYWTGFIDNSKINSSDLRYTLLPSDGGNNITIKTYSKLYTTPKPQSNTELFYDAEQSNLRLIWSDEILDVTNEFSGKTFPAYNQYSRIYNSGNTYDNFYGINSNFRKIIDLIGTFSPDILNEFESIFLEFATEKINSLAPFIRFNKVNYYKFQDLLNDIVSVTKINSDSNLSVDDLILQLKTRQLNNLKDITNKILSTENLLSFTIANPKEINPYMFNGFILGTSGNTFTYSPFNSSQINQTNLNAIKLYIGEDIESKYINFFSINNVELSVENILRFRPLILSYAGYVNNGNANDQISFKNYLANSIYGRSGSVPRSMGFTNRLNLFLDVLIGEFKNLITSTTNRRIDIIGGYNIDGLKLELYNYFKSFNDKWIAGNSIGQRNLIEEFLFLDRANRDIGDRFYLNLNRLSALMDEKNIETSLYGAISMLIEGTGLDMRALPAYVNFYGTNFSNVSKITPSKNVAKNLFGTFLEVDYQESSPKIIIQLVAGTSKHPSDMDNKVYKFADDSFDIRQINKNPLLVTLPEVYSPGVLAKSNKVVSFEVSFGDENQSFFKGVTLDQETLKNTTEAFIVTENLGRSESGSGTYNVDIGLFEYYRQASYTVQVTCMGNVMIQPTMYFYVKNIPMFRGTYWVMDVNHSIKNNTIVTTFKGVRMPVSPFPDPKDSFLSSYRTLFDKIKNTATSKVKDSDLKTNTTIINVTTNQGNFKTDPGKLLKNETLDLIMNNSAGANPFGVHFNGDENIDTSVQRIKFTNNPDDIWLRTRVVKMGGAKYNVDDKNEMELINKLDSKLRTINPKKLPWAEIKNTGQYFFACKFDLRYTTADYIASATTTFYNPQTKGDLFTLTPNYQLDKDHGKIQVQGAVDIIPNSLGYGIVMSGELMKKLDLHDDDVVYFKMEKK